MKPTEADLLLHVVDASSPVLDEQMDEVDRVLREIGADAIPQILVFNKQDLLEPSQRPRAASDWLELPGGVRVRRVFVSSLTGEGLDLLRREITRTMQELDAKALLNNRADLPHDDVDPRERVSRQDFDDQAPLATGTFSPKP